jgi:hypothetical protein
VPAVSYSEILRVIGQDLETRAIKAFDIRDEGDRILVQCGYQVPPAATPVTLHYTPRDIEELKPQAAETRGFFYSFPDLESHWRICRSEKSPFAPPLQ